MNGYNLRSATNADSDAIKELVFAVLREYRLQPDPDGTDSDLSDIETNYLRSGGCFDVLVDSCGAIVGTVGLYPIDSVTCELRKMYLSRQVRGQGQGRWLLEHALGGQRKSAFNALYLRRHPCSKKQSRFTRDTGFDLTKRLICPTDAMARTSSLCSRHAYAVGPVDPDPQEIVENLDAVPRDG